MKRNASWSQCVLSIIVLFFFLVSPSHSDGLKESNSQNYFLKKQTLENQLFFNKDTFNNTKNSIIPKKSYHLGYYVLVLMALTGIIPVIVFFIEHNLSGLYVFINHFKKCRDYNPRIAVVIPSWNEALVLEHTITILLQTDYSLDKLKLFIVDDGSTDNTQELIKKIQAQFPDNIINIYKQEGGRGKAHALNFGLQKVLSNDWAEAILFIDADVSFKKTTLHQMARHLVDPEIGAVTAYIKVGNREPNFISRSVGFEYIVSQAIARRAQNVIGVLSCLAGGAQLHSRENIELLNGQINTSTLAEDTYTTFATQQLGKKVIFEGNAVIYAEEPTSIVDIWKQRFRWARGNIQITKAFKSFWFRKNKSVLGGFLFGIFWFCILLTPLMMILTAIGLVGIFLLDKNYSAQLFFYLAYLSLFVYLYTTLYAILADTAASKLSWFEAITYPGIIALMMLFISINPTFFFTGLNSFFKFQHPQRVFDLILLFMESWCALCMLCAWLIFRCELWGLPTRLTKCLLVIVGYGPLLCTINFTAYIAELKRPNIKWHKTEKISSDRVPYARSKQVESYNYEKNIDSDYQHELRIFYCQLTSLFCVSGLFILFHFIKI